MEFNADFKNSKLVNGFFDNERLFINRVPFDLKGLNDLGLGHRAVKLFQVINFDRHRAGNLRQFFGKGRGLLFGFLIFGKFFLFLGFNFFKILLRKKKAREWVSRNG